MLCNILKFYFDHLKYLKFHVTDKEHTIINSISYDCDNNNTHEQCVEICCNKLEHLIAKTL